MLVQDSVPAHETKNIKTYLKGNLPVFVPEDIWPSSSPCLNVFDFCLFSVIEKQSITLLSSLLRPLFDDRLGVLTKKKSRGFAHCFAKGSQNSLKRCLIILNSPIEKFVMINLI